MEQLGTIVGWILYILLALYAASGFVYIINAIRRHGSVTRPGLSQWTVAVVCLVFFGITEFHRLHLLWVIPVGLFLSFTPIGMAIGTAVGQFMGATFESK